MELYSIWLLETEKQGCTLTLRTEAVPFGLLTNPKSTILEPVREERACPTDSGKASRDSWFSICL